MPSALRRKAPRRPPRAPQKLRLVSPHPYRPPSLTDGPRFVLPRGIPVVWEAGLVRLRIEQIGRWFLPTNGLNGNQAPPGRDEWHARAGVDQLMREGAVGGPLYGLRCPSCRKVTQRLVLELDGRWHCPGGCGDPPRSALERLVSRYAFALLIGLHHSEVGKLRQRLALEIRALALRMRAPDEAALVARGTEVVGWEPDQRRQMNNARGAHQGWQRNPFRRPTRHTAVWYQLGPRWLDAFVDTMLHYEAYRQRVGLPMLCR